MTDTLLLLLPDELILLFNRQTFQIFNQGFKGVHECSSPTISPHSICYLGIASLDSIERQYIFSLSILTNMNLLSFLKTVVMILSVCVTILVVVTPGCADMGVLYGCPPDESSPDNSACCWSRLNLQKENVGFMRAPPTVVDYDITSGNILVRGPLPLIIRNGTGIQKNTCQNLSDWRFAGDELVEIVHGLGEKSSSCPAYFTAEQCEKMKAELGKITPDQVEFYVFSLIDSHEVDLNYLNTEIAAFGGKPVALNEKPTCKGLSAPIDTSGIQSGRVIWWPTGYWKCNTDAPTDLCGCTGPEDKKCIADHLNFISEADYCSFTRGVDQMTELMKGSGEKKRIIYFHCVLGTDRTGAYTMGYLLKKYPDLSFCDAYNYTRYLGQTKPPHNFPEPLPIYRRLAYAYSLTLGRNTTWPCQDSKPEVHDILISPVSDKNPFIYQFSGLVTASSPVRHEWDIDGDGKAEYTRPEVIHTYQWVGDYEITLKVIDDKGRYDTRTEILRVESPYKPLNLSWKYKVPEPVRNTGQGIIRPDMMQEREGAGSAPIIPQVTVF